MTYVQQPIDLCDLRIASASSRLRARRMTTSPTTPIGVPPSRVRSVNMCWCTVSVSPASFMAVTPPSPTPAAVTDT
jgi:hypothetical protein